MTATVEDAVKAINALLPGLMQAAIELERWAENAANDKVVGPAEIGIALFQIVETHSAIDAVVKKVYHVKDRIDKSIMPTRLADFDLDMVRVPEIARSFSVLDKMSASLVDKVEGFKWLRANGLGDLVQETVNAGTLAAAMRNLILEQGIDPPPEIVKVSTYKATSVNKYTPKAGVK
jgi:hypothetical protein